VGGLLVALLEGRLPRHTEGQLSRDSLEAHVLGIGLNAKLSLFHQLDALLPQELNFKIQFVNLLGELSSHLHNRLIFLGKELLVLLL
jgi:hypothetical protein